MTLADTMAGLIRRATVSQQVARAKLPRGLYVSVLMIEPDIYGLQLARDDNYPSDVEWRTVIKAMPVGCLTVELPKKFTYPKMFFLKGQIRLARQDQLEVEHV